jgi:SAM-dependent MidA family methyltransferase
MRNSMASASPMVELLRKMLEEGDLPFREFMEIALYHPEFGYYSKSGQRGDYVTSPALSPLFSWAIGRLVSEFLSRCGDAMTSIVDIGCGAGELIRALPGSRRFGIDRSLARVTDFERVTFGTALDVIPRDGAHFIISNELFDAFPFARLVQRGRELHELYISRSADVSSARDEHADETSAFHWSEHPAPSAYIDYFAETPLADGQFADVSLEWGTFYDRMASLVTRGMIVTFDYGFRERQLFDVRIRKYGTAAAYRGHRVTRDLLSHPGEQDLTAHINFSDLERAGARHGFTTHFFGSQAKYLLSLGAAEHPLFAQPPETMSTLDEALAFRERREEARRLILPDGIGEDIRVLVQVKGVG